MREMRFLRQTYVPHKAGNSLTQNYFGPSQATSSAPQQIYKQKLEVVSKQCSMKDINVAIKIAAMAERRRTKRDGTSSFP